jgi:hypothetical protein
MDAGETEGESESDGQSEGENHRLEFHHLKPFAAGGDHCASNLTLRCTAHNALAAEEDFGRELVEDRKACLRHEPSAFHGDDGLVGNRTW